MGHDDFRAERRHYIEFSTKIVHSYGAYDLDVLPGHFPCILDGRSYDCIAKSLNMGYAELYSLSDEPSHVTGVVVEAPPVLPGPASELSGPNERRSPQQQARDPDPVDI